jgi:hypothetical protein
MRSAVNSRVFGMCMAAVLTSSCGGDDASDGGFGGISADETAGSEDSRGTDAGTGMASMTGAASASATDDDGPADDTGFKFDVYVGDLPPTGECACGEASAFSYIWIANSPQSTVSKVDTINVQEVGRYLTRSDAAGNPSRTSVSISGRAVAVANRHGGVIKIFANDEDCIEKNGVPGIQTSSGAADVLAWDQDECVHWYRDFPTYTVQRPIAWAPGTFNEVTCRWEDEVVWTAGCGGGGSPGFGGSTTTNVHLLDGETGLDVAMVQLADYSCQGFGPYGGAVDSEGNFWMIQNNNQLAVVYRDTLTHKVWNKSPNAAPYGLTVDSKGRAWITSYSQTVGAARFDPVTETWDEIFDAVLIGNGQSGIAQGGDGRIWMGVSSGGVGIASIDPETLQVLDIHPVPGVSGKGISVDGHGYVWRAGGSTATRIHPDDGTSDQYVGLTSAYTYSDMTGFGIANASGCTPAG